MEIGIESFGADLGDLLGLATGDVVEEAPQLDAGVQRTQLLLVQVQHLVHPPLVFELKTTNGQF